jgi:hypothetical protein
MAEIILESDNKDAASTMVKEAIITEKQRLNYSLSLARKHLENFEEKYRVSSEKFLSDWTAEDLDGKDMEYVQWAGEYSLAGRLKERLDTIDGITYVS